MWLIDKLIKLILSFHRYDVVKFLIRVLYNKFLYSDQVSTFILNKIDWFFHRIGKIFRHPYSTIYLRKNPKQSIFYGIRGKQADVSLDG